MPNQPKTPVHSLRITDDLWHAAQQAAVEAGCTVSDIIRRALESFLRGNR